MALTAIVKYLAVKRYIILTISILIFINLCLITKNTIGQTEDKKYLYGQELYEKTFRQSKQVSEPSKPNDNLNTILAILVPIGIVIFFLLLLSKSNLDFTGILNYLTGRYVIKKKGGTLIIIDGDTFWSKRHNNKIRILGIDCPEKEEPGYQEAKDFLYELLESSTLRIKKKGIDKYGRILAEIFVNGENIASKIKEKGFDKLNSTYKEKFPEPVKILSDAVEEIKEEFRCETCHREISEEEYYEFNGLCRWCRGVITQKGFPSPPGFPKAF